MAAENILGKQPEPLSLFDRLGLIDLISQGMQSEFFECPLLPDLFQDLWSLVEKTAAGAKINHLKPNNFKNGFRAIEINGEKGENLGRLNMLYFKKPIPCYYLVYVEVAAPFRRKGLGNQVLKYFGDFLSSKKAIGILDNIIPKDDPTYKIYEKQGWISAKEVIGQKVIGNNNYIIFAPSRISVKDLKTSILRLVYHLRRKQAAIDMRENEEMVKKTIAEFKSLYSALLVYFKNEIEAKEPKVQTRFMFTRFVTKFIAFRRQISKLVGYTGGDSLEQINLDAEIASWPVQTYAPYNLPASSFMVNGNKELWESLPKGLRDNPAKAISLLPNYSRPNFLTWMKKNNISSKKKLNIGDLMNLGFDPTRLKEFSINGEEFIFERMQSKLLPEIEEKKAQLEYFVPKLTAQKAKSAEVKVNPPLLAIEDKGNGYILRRKLPGIHWEEAIEQLKINSNLTSLNDSLGIDRLIKSVVTKTQLIVENLGVANDNFAYFVPWDLKKNQPKLMIDFSQIGLESVWIA